MNKKIMSFVLAMVLSVGLGVISSFASSTSYDSSNYGNKFTSYYANKTASGSVKIQIGSEKDLLKGNLTGVFGYYAGTMVSYQGAGGNFTVYDSYGARATLSNSGENFKVQSFNLRTADLANMPKVDDYVQKNADGSYKTEKSTVYTYTGEDGKSKTITKEDYDKLSGDDKKKCTITEKTNYVFNSEEAKAEYCKKMKDFLVGLGYTEEQLAITQTDANGNLLDSNGDPIKYKEDNGGGFDGELMKGSISADWYVELSTQLQKGGDSTATVSVGNGVSGPSLTVSENGKPRLTYGTNSFTGEAVPTTLYKYEGELLVGVQTATFEVEKTDDNIAQGKWTFNYTEYCYDKNTGRRTDKTYAFFNWVGDDEIAETIAKASKPSDEKAEANQETPCLLVSQVNYSANGSTLSQVDYKTNETTYFANNKASYVVNKEGVTVGKYEYTANGVVMSYFNANGWANNDKTEATGTTTVYDEWGRSLFSCNTGSANQIIGNKENREKMLKEYYDGISGAGFSDSTTISGIYIYADYGNGITVDFSKLGYTDNDVKNMMNFNNGSAALGYTQIVVDSWETTDSAGVNTKGANSDSTTEYTSAGTHNYHSTLGTKKTYKGNLTYNNTIFVGGSQAYSTEYKMASSVTNSTVIESDPAVEGEMIDVDKEISVTDEELEEQGIDPKDTEAVKTYKLKKLAEKLGLTIPTDEKEAETFFKNLENGIYEADGKTYAIVVSSSINLMDGSGFQTTEGEVIFVEISEEIKSEIVNGIKAGDSDSRKVMFMGDVRESVNGHLTMAINEHYGGGFVQSEEIEAAKKQIESDSIVVSNIASKYDISTFKGMSDEDIRNTEAYNEACRKLGIEVGDVDNDWVVVNTLKNIGTFGGVFNIKDNKKGGLEEAWSILLANF